MPDARRTLLAIEQSSDNTISGRVEEAGAQVSRQTMPLRWQPSNEPLTSEAALAAYGVAVRDALYSHPDIRRVLQSVFQAPPSETWNLHLDIAGPTGEAIRWEMLQNDVSKHVALRSSPRLGRIAWDPASPQLVPQAVPARLRFAAFLSAAGIPARNEYQGLRTAVLDARQQGLSIELTAYVAEQTLLDESAAGEPGITVQPMPANTLALQQELTRTKPHLLHFFCHGISEPGQTLEFATVVDQAAGSPRGSVRLSIDRLIECGVLGTVWAVVFNCCDGGRPTTALNSMAFRAVAHGGAPASIGMGTPIPADAAVIFSGAFYTALLAGIAGAAQAAGTDDARLDFCEAIVLARQALHDAIASSGTGCNCWSLPIIYLHRQPFSIKKSAPQLTPQALEKLNTVIGALKAQPPDTPAEVRTKILELLATEPSVPKELWPNTFGVFGAAGGH